LIGVAEHHKKGKKAGGGKAKRKIEHPVSWGVRRLESRGFGQKNQKMGKKKKWAWGGEKD